MRISTRLSLVCFLLCSLLFKQELKAQANAQFMGKTYKVFPQIINSYYTNVNFDIEDLKFYNLDIPPIVGQFTDGEYLLYSKRFDLKNKRIVNNEYVYDTIRKVFAIIPIKNNKKEGIVTVYDEGTQLPVYRIPYKNDMIDGHFVLYETASNIRPHRYSRHSRYDWEESYYEDVNIFLKGYSAVPVKAKKIELNYKEGFIDGVLTVYACTKKDTVLVDSMTLEKGWLQGLKTKYDYQMYNKRITKITSTYTHYKDNAEIGHTSNYNFLDQSKKVSVYDDNTDLLAEYEYSQFNRLKKATLYGLDSIKKYYPNYKEIANFPDVTPDYEYDEGGLYAADQLVMYYKDNKQTDFAIKYDNFVSVNFSALERYNYRDTIMMGKFFRIKTYDTYDKIVSTCYLIDTCTSKIGSKSCAKVYTRSFEFKKLTSANYTEKTNLYYQMNPNETVQNVAINTTVKKGKITQKYYYAPLNYHYYNHTFTKGKFAGARSYYKVQGTTLNGSIIHYLKVPMKYDSLMLIDTIMFKGQYTYKLDKLFYDSYTKFLLTTERNSSWSSSNDKYDFFDLLTSMLNYFELIPNQHKAIYVGRQAFTGNVELNWHYKRRPNNFKAKMYEIKQVWALKPTLVIELDVEARKTLLSANKSKLIAPTKRIKINSGFGAFTGTYSMTDIFDHSSTYTHYLDNKLNDDIEYSLYTSTKSKYNKAIQFKHLQRAETSMMNYENGKKEGQWQLNTESNYSSGLTQLVFHNNQLNGTQYQFKNNSGYKCLSRVYEMKNDTINGAIWKLSRTGYPISKGYFKMGIPDGQFIRYNVSDFRVRDTAKYVSEVIPFKHGYLDGTYKLYRDTNNLKYTVQLSIKDSMFYSVFKSNSRSYDDEHNYESRRIRVEEQNNKFFNGHDFMDNLPSRFRSGYYTYYYKSGFVFKKGQKSYSDPTGLWSFYREGQGRLFKTIDFKDSMVYLSKTDSISTVGLVKAYYDNGQLMYEGWAENMDTKYTCESEADMPTEEDHYLSFYDENGKSLLENGSGVITELQASGHKLKEGRLEQYKKQGVWVYYNNYGQAEAMGLYENGLKVGRWITGDLSGLHLSEKVCFMSNEEYFDWIAQYGGDLNFKEEFYNKGQLIQSNGVDTIRR